MENATKALLIAAAILIAIVLISIGVYVLGIGQEAVKGADMTQQEITSFNSRWLAYEGTHVMGSKVNALLQAVVANNISEGEDGKRIEVDGSVSLGVDDTAVGDKANTGESYSIECETNSAGLVTAIHIGQ